MAISGTRFTKLESPGDMEANQVISPSKMINFSLQSGVTCTREFLTPPAPLPPGVLFSQFYPQDLIVNSPL